MTQMYRETHSEPPPFKRVTIGRYDVIYPLASGGMATVYVGRLSGMAGFEKLVTLKIIHSHLATQHQFVDMFLDEARLAAKIHHPNIGEIYEIVEDDGQLFIAAEFVDGRSLNHLLRASRKQRIPISHSTAAWICAEICRGLQTVHDLTDDNGRPLNLVHRDISPSNILLSYDGWVKLIDFGIAFAENRLAHTSPGSLKGKIGYISPEQLTGMTLDRRADIFSLGVILYQLTTGRHPFAGKTDVERLRKTIDYKLVPPSKRAQTIDAQLEAIILRALAKSPDRRYQEASDLEQDLRHYIAKKPDITGASDVSFLMQSLFAKRKIQHQERISEFKHKTPTPTVGYDSRGFAVSSIPPERTSTPAASTPPATSPAPAEKKQRFSGRELVIFVVIGGIVASVLTAGVFRLLSASSPTPRSLVIDSATTVHDPKTASTSKAAPSEARPGNNRESTPDTGVRQGNTAAAQALIDIAVTLHPSETELLLNGNTIHVDENAIKLPSDGQRYDIIARAPGYVTETHSVIAEKGQTLSVDLSPSPSESANQKKKTRKWKRQKPDSKKAAKHSSRVLKRNPY